MTTVESLKHGQTLLVSVRPVSGGKIQMEIAEHVINPNRGMSVVSLLNASDERFQGGRPRRAWISAEPKDAKEYFPTIADKIDEAVELGKAAIKEERDPKSVAPIEVNLLNPSINGIRLHIQVTEKTQSELEEEYAEESTSDSRRYTIEWISNNWESSVKRAGVEGQFLFHKGENIVSETAVVASEPAHRFLEITGRSKFLNGDDIGHSASLVEKQEIESSEEISKL